MQEVVSQHAPATSLVVETVVVVVPYTGEPSILNFDKVAAYKVKVFLAAQISSIPLVVGPSVGRSVLVETFGK